MAIDYTMNQQEYAAETDHWWAEVQRLMANGHGFDSACQTAEMHIEDEKRRKT